MKGNGHRIVNIESVHVKSGDHLIPGQMMYRAKLSSKETKGFSIMDDPLSKCKSILGF